MAMQKEGFEKNMQRTISKKQSGPIHSCHKNEQAFRLCFVQTKVDV